MVLCDNINPNWFWMLLGGEVIELTLSWSLIIRWIPQTCIASTCLLAICKIDSNWLAYFQLRVGNVIWLIKRRLNKPGKRKPQQSPTPQNRAADMSMKITQWILTLLRNPEFNPSIIAWKDEKDGIFHINDTDSFARLWGAHKKNNNMTYEKLSRSMRWVYVDQLCYQVKFLII